MPPKQSLPHPGTLRNRHRTNRRNSINASVLPETLEYLDALDTSRGETIDAAIKLYADRRHTRLPVDFLAFRRIIP